MEWITNNFWVTEILIFITGFVYILLYSLFQDSKINQKLSNFQYGKLMIMCFFLAAILFSSVVWMLNRQPTYFEQVIALGTFCSSLLFTIGVLIYSVYSLSKDYFPELSKKENLSN